MAVWDDIINERDAWVIQNNAFGNRRGFGKTPALIIIDAQVNFVGERLPIEQSIAKYPSSIGEEAWDAVDKTVPLLQMAREKGMPVIFSRWITSEKDGVYDSFRRKMKPTATQGLHTRVSGVEIIDALKPLDNEIVIDKLYASCFFATPFETILRSLGVDTLIVTGFVTAGCVRATAIDGASYNYNVIIPEECVKDRITVSHKASLLDLDLKYADVMPVDEVLAKLKTY
jgi:nicotinamidase-related amidase